MKFDIDKKTWAVSVKCRNEAEVKLFFEYIKLGTEAYIKKILEEMEKEETKT